MSRVLGVLCLAVVLGCQPHTRRALLLDLALSDDALVGGTATPWVAAGYGVDYRRFYPHLTREDLTRYGVVVILAGRTPEVWSDALSAADLALLTGWVPRGGVLVFGYDADGEGSQDRWVINRWLAAMGAGVAIEAAVLADTSRAGLDPPGAHPPARPAGPLTITGQATFPAGRNHPLRVRRPTQALARAPASAFVVPRPGAVPETRADAPIVAASRIGSGLVIVTSRHLLAALGPELRGTPLSAITRDSITAARRFLTALARWTRRPAEWSAVPPAERREPLVLQGAPVPLSNRPPPATPPAPVPAVRLRDGRILGDTVAIALPGWVAQHGMRIGWSGAAITDSQTLTAVLGFLDAADLNSLASPLALGYRPGPDVMRGPSGDDLPAWRDALRRLGATSVRWFPVLPVPPADSGATACLLDPAVWSDYVRVALRRVGTFATMRGAPVAGVAIELRATDLATLELCDGNLRAGLARLGWAPGSVEDLLGRASAARYDTLLTEGILPAYVAALEDELGARAAAAAAEARRAAPGLLFAVWLRGSVTDWRVAGLARGLAGDAVPVFVWDTEPLAHHTVAAFRSRGLATAHVLSLPAEALPRRAWAAIRRTVFDQGAGFGVGPIEGFVGDQRAMSSDSLARLLRRFSKAP